MKPTKISYTPALAVTEQDREKIMNYIFQFSIFNFQFAKQYVLIFLMICLILCTSCVTRRFEKYSTPPLSANTTNILTTRYGIQVTQKDNQVLYNTITQWLGAPYQRGGNSIRGTDCSGFAGNIYQTVYRKNIARSSADILRLNCSKISRQNLREGDLVFFATGVTKKISHVGIYLKDGKFAHASTSKGVIISNLNETYYRKRWVSGGRVR